MVGYFFLLRYYRKTSIEIQRQEAISRAPILSHLSTSLEGAATIRAYAMEKQFKTSIMNKIDLNTVDFYALRYCATWFGIRLDWCGSAIILTTYLAVVLSRNFGTIDSGA
jgi:ABC-type multidrug transport system fused ATPase/permease subunit